ncbi:MAG: AAA family ATPase [Candidatus Helarchaeota archaeon]
MNVKEKSIKILEILDDGLLERDVPLKLSFLATIAGECFFMLGSPGVAKSLIARRLTKAFKDAKIFIYLMNRFSTPDEVFGPYSIRELKDNDNLIRKTEGYLPDANICFLDEIWKASPSIQNTLLTIINEKIFRNGNFEDNVNLYGILAASNELPEKNQGLEALWDRFLVRVLVQGIEDKSNFESMILATDNLMNPTIPNDLQISLDELSDWQYRITEIQVPQEVLDVIHHIRNQLYNFNEKNEENENDEEIIVSDRRWKKIINFLRTSAFLNGRKKVDLMDCFLISYCIWSNPDQIDQIEILIRDAIRNHGYQRVIDTESIEFAIEELNNDVESETHFIKEVKKNELIVYENKTENKCYYKVSEFGDRYCRILESDWNNLKKHKEIQVQFYDKDLYYNKYYWIIKKSDFYFEYDEEKYYLETRERVDKKRMTKKPHQAVINTWNSEVDKIKDKINREKLNLKNYIDIDLAHIKSNIFVPQENSTIVLNKIKEINNVLNQLEVRLLKIQDYYTKIK